MTRGVVEGKVLDAEARFRISIDINKQHRFVHRIEDFEKNFVVEKKKKTIQLLVLYACTRVHSSSARPLVPATILLHCPRKFARWRSIINHASSPPSFVPLADIARSIHSDGV